MQERTFTAPRQRDIVQLMRTAAELSRDDYQAQEKVDRFFAFWRALPCPPHRVAPSVETLLDNAQADLQPFVALVDITAPEMLRVRLFGTAREAAFGANITQTNALDVFEPHLRPHVFERVATLARHPAGWLTQRITTSSRGNILRFLSLTLPLTVESGRVPCVVNFGATMDVRPDGEMVPKVNAVMGCHWIDIGAGIPSLSPSF